MNEFLTDNIWQEVKKHSSKSTLRMAAIAYVKSDKYLKLKKGDILICDASDHRIASDATSAELLSRWHKKGVDIYSNSNLHSKVVVTDSHALIGSANLTPSSEKILREACLLTSDKQIIAQARAFIQIIKHDSRTKPIDIDFIDHIKNIEVKKGVGYNSSRTRGTKKIGNRLWVVKSYPYGKDLTLREEKDITKAAEKISEIKGRKIKDPAWFKANSNSVLRKQAKVGDMLVFIEASSHRLKQFYVSPPAAILIKQSRKEGTRFYYDEIPDKEDLSFTNFKKRAAKAGFKNFQNKSKEIKQKNIEKFLSIWKSD